MHRARERGMSFWPFLVTLILLMVVVIMWFSASSERDNALAAEKKAKAAREEWEQKWTTLNSKFTQATAAVGYQGGEGYVDAAMVQAGIADYGKKLREIMVIEFPTTRYQAGEGGGSIEKT